MIAGINNIPYLTELIFTAISNPPDMSSNTGTTNPAYLLNDWFILI